MTTRRQFSATTLATLAATALPGRAQTVAAAAPIGLPMTLAAAVAGSWRTPGNSARDAARHPLETLAFFGLAGGQTVIELSPGGGWYTEILAPFLRAQGRYVAAHYPRDDADDGHRRSRAAFESRLAAAPALYDRVQVGTLAGDGPLIDCGAPGSADGVLTFRNVHNWIEQGRFDDKLRACHRALKPGGWLGVVDHRAAPGTALEQMKSSGYVTEALVTERARAAGFTLQARSEVNANPRDSHAHPHGVWSLPPTLRGGEAERARFVAIGESDRFTHLYVKRAG